MKAAFKWPFLEHGRPNHARTLRIFRKGLLSQGFVWELADHDEIFAARLRREGIADIRNEMDGGKR